MYRFHTGVHTSPECAQTLHTKHRETLGNPMCKCATWGTVQAAGSVRVSQPLRRAVCRPTMRTSLPDAMSARPSTSHPARLATVAAASHRPTDDGDTARTCSAAPAHRQAGSKVTSNQRKEQPPDHGISPTGWAAPKPSPPPTRRAVHLPYHTGALDTAARQTHGTNASA